MGTPSKQTGPDMRLKQNKQKYGTTDNRDKTAPRGKLNPGKQQPPANKNGGS